MSWDYGIFVLHTLILQTRIPSHPEGLDVWCFVGPFVYFHNLCVWTAKALARLRGCGAGSPEPSLVALVISTIISWAGSFMHTLKWYLYIKAKCKHEITKVAVVRNSICDIVFCVRTFWVLCLDLVTSVFLNFEFYVLSVSVKTTYMYLTQTIISIIYTKSLHADISKPTRKTAMTIQTSHISIEIIYSPVPRPLLPLYLIG